MSLPSPAPGVDALERLAARTWRGLEEQPYGDWPVSYTHLTLPTICSV